MGAPVHGLHLLSPAAVAAAAALALAAAPAAAGATAPAVGARPWLDAPLGYLLRTEDELGVDVVLVLRAVAQLTGDARATEVAEVRRLGFTASEIGRLAPLLTIDLPILPPAGGAVAPLPPEPLPPAPLPSAARPVPRLTHDGRQANAVTCVERAAACELAPGCVDWATDASAGGLDLTHQAAWLLFARWRGCPLAIDEPALQAAIAARLLYELGHDDRYSETHLERVATLGQLGYGDRIEPAWIQPILAARSPQGCWGGTPAGPCHPHPTAIALWALALAERSGAWSPASSNGGP